LSAGQGCLPALLRLVLMNFIKRPVHFLGYLAVKATTVLFALLPWDRAVKAGAFMGRAATGLVRGRFELTKENIRRALPELSEAQVRETALKSWENMGVVVAEVLSAAQLGKKELLSRFEVTNPQVLRDLQRQGRGAIVHFGHFANWELAAVGISALDLPVCAVVRHIRNPYVDDMLKAIRTRFGAEVIFHRDPFFSCVRNLKRGKFLGILMDQNCPAGDIYAPFMGRQAATTPLTALLALKLQTPVLPMRVTRANGKLLVTFEEPIYPDTAYSPETMHALIDKLNARLEAWIRAEPHLWLWAHNRWKREGDALRFEKEHIHHASARA